MSTIYTINITNKSNNNQDFFIFQEPAKYIGGATVYSNSLYHELVAPAANGGGVMQFQTNIQYYAAVQEQKRVPAIGQVCGGVTASQPINVTPANGVGTGNAAAFSIEPLTLAKPTDESGVQGGAFRIIAPVYSPTAKGNFNVGLASQPITPGAPAILSNFVVAQPNQHVDCQPVLKFYIATGAYKAGQVINFTNASNVSAICDATTGASTFQVTYLENGTWSVNPQ